MNDWSVWEPAYARLTLAADGDQTESDFARDHGFGAILPNWEAFWRFHVAPATNRPVDLAFRKTAAPEVCCVMAASYSVLVNLHGAAQRRASVEVLNDLGRPQNFTEAVKSAGDAVQIFETLQRAIQEPLAKRLGRDIRLWPPEDWKKIWNPRRELIITYRNYLTHEGVQPRIVLVGEDPACAIPHALKSDYVVRGQPIGWNEQAELYGTNPERFERLSVVFDALYAETAAWLNDVYAEVRKAMDPLLGLPEYHELQGWSQPRYGSGSGPGLVRR